MQRGSVSFLTNFAFLSVLAIPGIMIDRKCTKTAITQFVMKQPLTYFFLVNQTVKMRYSHRDHDFLHTESILRFLPLLWQNFHISYSYCVSFQDSEHTLVQHPLKK